MDAVRHPGAVPSNQAASPLFAWGSSAALVLVVLLAVPVGPAASTRIYTKVEIAKPPEAVYDFVTTPANWPRWHPSSLAVSRATDHPLEAGEQVVEDFQVAGRRGRAAWTVVQRVAPRLWTIEAETEGSGRAVITYVLTAKDGGTLFERELVYRFPNLLLTLLDPWLFRPRIEAESAEALARLKRELESR